MNGDESDEPRALFALPGLDPHSGGFAVDVTFLLLGGASTVAVTLLASALARARAGEAVDVVGGAGSPANDDDRQAAEGAVAPSAPTKNES